SPGPVRAWSRDSSFWRTSSIPTGSRRPREAQRRWRSRFRADEAGRPAAERFDLARARGGQRARDGSGADQHAGGHGKHLVAVALAQLEQRGGDGTADETTHVAAPGDPGDREAD